VAPLGDPGKTVVADTPKTVAAAERRLLRTHPAAGAARPAQA
jgi:hypothetical protein